MSFNLITAGNPFGSSIDTADISDGAITSVKLDASVSAGLPTTLSDTTLGGAGTFDITPLDTTSFSKLKITLQGATTTDNTSISLKLNNDGTGGNYNRTYVQVNNSVVSSGSGSASPVDIGTGSSTSFLSNIEIFNSDSFPKSGIVITSNNVNSAGTNAQFDFFRWNSNSKITRITLTAGGAGTFKTGTRLLIQGCA